MKESYPTSVNEQFQSTHQGQNIQFFRWIGNITVSGLAKQLNIEDEELKALEQQSKIASDTLNKVANILGVEIKWLECLNKVPTGNFIQNGDGNHNFLKNEKVNVHYNPLETLKEFMTTSMSEIKSSYEETRNILIERNRKQELEIENLKVRIRELEGL